MYYICYTDPDRGSVHETAPGPDEARSRILWLEAARSVDPAGIRVFDEADAVTPDGPDTSSCPACGKHIDQDDIDVNNNEEDGYGDMTVPHTCPHCGTALTARYDAQDGYAFLGFETD